MSERDEAVVAQLVEETRTIRLGRKDFWPQFLPQFNEAMRARVPLAYGLKATEAGPRLAFLETMNLGSATVKADMDRGFSRQPGDYVAFNPLRPELHQRNTVKTMRDLQHHPVRTQPASVMSLWKGAGIANHDQIRVLVCEDESLLAWVGAFRL